MRAHIVIDEDLMAQAMHSGIAVLIAAFCIEDDDALLHRDRDFHAFEDHRGLRGWAH
jgi:predicted nucleic acid-binding protein